AATACGFTMFNWQQKVINLPDPSPFYTVNHIHLTSASTQFNDPFQGGYDYDVHCPGGTISSAYRTAYPFYYDPLGSQNDCFSLAHNRTPTQLSFVDVPKDACLVDPSGIASEAWLHNPQIRARCNNTTAPPGSFVGFTAALVGLKCT